MIHDTFDVHTSVETGTYLGDTAAMATRFFSRVFTVELSDELYRNASTRLAIFSGAKTYKGLSQDRLQEILPLVSQEPTAFFLDAHYSEDNTARGPQNTPILIELGTILQNCTKCVILIDDVRCFQPTGVITAFVNKTGKSSLLGYPSLSDLKDFACNLVPDIEFYILGDIALLYTKSKFNNI